MPNPIIPRKHDKWMVPVIVALLPILFVAFTTSIRWAKATDKDMKAVERSVKLNDEQDARTKSHIDYLMKCEAASRTADAELKIKLDNLIKTVDNIAGKQEKILDRVIILIQNGKDKNSGYERTDQ